MKVSALFFALFLCQNANAGLFDFLKQAADSLPANPPPQTQVVGNYQLQWSSNSGTGFTPRDPANCSDAPVDTAVFGATRYQGKLGVCYAYATADILSACLKTTRVSAMDIALNYAQSEWNTSDPQDFFKLLDSGGTPWYAVDILQKGKSGVCPERNMTSDSGSYHDVENLGPESLYSQYNHGTDALLAKIFDLRKEFDETRANTGQGGLHCVSPCGNGCFKRLGVSAPGVFGDPAFVNILSQTSVRTTVQELDTRICDKHRASMAQCLPMQAYQTSAISQDQPNVMNGYTLFGTIDSRLSQGKPLEFIANSGFLKGDSDTGGGAHAMVLIGRHYRPATATEPAGCYYQVRNSWGADCTGYSRFVKDCDPKTGYFWISEETLSKNLDGLMYTAN